MRPEDTALASGENAGDWIDGDGYPCEDALVKIREWPHTDFMGLWGFVKGLWRYPQFISMEDHEPGQPDIWAISTGGWSGNEDIIHAMKENRIFWSFCWVSSRRGGHYEFEIKNLK